MPTAPAVCTGPAVLCVLCFTPLWPSCGWTPGPVKGWGCWGSIRSCLEQDSDKLSGKRETTQALPGTVLSRTARMSLIHSLHSPPCAHPTSTCGELELGCLLPASRRWDGCRPGTPTPQLLPVAHTASTGCSSDCLLSIIPAGPSETETPWPCLLRGQWLQPWNQMQSDKFHTALEPAVAFLFSFYKGLQTPVGPENREAWCAAVHGVAKSWTRQSN